MIQTLKSLQTENIQRSVLLKLQPIGKFHSELQSVIAVNMVEDSKILGLIRNPLSIKPDNPLDPLTKYTSQVILTARIIFT